MRSSSDTDSDDSDDASPVDAVVEFGPPEPEAQAPAADDPVAAAYSAYRLAHSQFFSTPSPEHRPGQWAEVQELRRAYRDATRRR